MNMKADENINQKKEYRIKEFINYITVEENLSPRTVKEYNHDLKLFFEFYKPFLKQELRLDTMDDKTIREFLTYLKINKSYTPKAINRKIATIRSYFDFLVTEGYLKTNPVQKLKSAKLGRHLPKVLTESDIKLFFETLYNTKDDFVIRDIAIFELFYASGIRISELTGINIEDIDFDNMMIKVKGKGDKERIVLINESAYKAINNYLNQRPQVNSRSLFISKKNTRLSARMIEYIFEKYLKKAGINKPASPHTLRHSFATHMLQRGSDLVTIKELLGHANLSTTQIYTNISLQHIKETYNKTHPRE